MAIDITVVGNQLKIVEGANKPKYVNADDADLAISGIKVGIMQTSSNNLVINADFDEYNTPSGGDATIVADAIAVLLGTAGGGGGGGGGDVTVIDPSTASAPTTVAVLTSSILLKAANANRVSATLTNYGTERVHLGFGGAATLTSAEFIDPGQIWITSKTLVINGIAPSGSNSVSITEYTK